MTKELDKEQIDAINDLKLVYGKNWKEELFNCWMNSSYPAVSETAGAALQRLRNSHGPSWLTAFAG